MVNTNDSLEKPKRKPGRPKKDREKQAADIAEMEEIRAKRMAELSQQRRAELVDFAFRAEIAVRRHDPAEMEKILRDLVNHASARGIYRRVEWNAL